jgi:hypothetical protein
MWRAQVSCTGENPPKPIEAFEDAGLDPRLAANIVRCKYRHVPPLLSPFLALNCRSASAFDCFCLTQSPACSN